MHSSPLLIVGQGLAGTLLSHALQKRHVDFRVMDPGHQHSASMVAAGMWNPIVFRRMNLSWKAQLLLPALYQVYAEFEKLLDAPLLFRKDIIKVFPNAAFADLFKKRLHEIEFSDLLECWPEDELPGGVKLPFGAGIIKQSGYVDLQQLLGKWRQHLTASGRLLEERFEYDSVKFTEEAIQYRDVNYSRIVFCEGYRNDHNPWFNYLPMKHVKGEVLSGLAQNIPYDFVLNNQSFLLPIDGKQFKMGSTYDWNNLNETPTDHGKKEITDRLNDFISFEYTLTDHKAGVRPAVSDRRPLLGHHPAHKALSIFNGLGTKGVLIGPYYAEHFADVICKSEALDREVDISRFTH
jgi:glycine/D-amino acid oxidase-like deaminating enzyme